MPQLDVFQSMWAMENLTPNYPAMNLVDKIERIAAAGFTGVSFDVPHHSIQMVEQAQPHLQANGLEMAINAFVSKPEDYQVLATKLSDFPVKTRFVGLIGQVQPWSVETVAKITQQWLDIGERSGIDTLVEIHRNCMTNDLLFTLQLMESLPQLRMIADLSHTLVNQEWYLPLSKEAKALVTQFLKRCQAFHGRVGTREQAQVPFQFAQHQQWLNLFKQWWLEGFSHWLNYHSESPDARCVFLCELGPPPYAITGADGYELSDRWDESLQLKSIAEVLWAEARKNNVRTGQC